MTKREFQGETFYAFCQQQFDEARRYLKTCGKPTDWFDKFKIEQAKITTQVFGKYL